MEDNRDIELEKAAFDYAVNHSMAPDKETPDWIMADFKAGAIWAALQPKEAIDYGGELMLADNGTTKKQEAIDPETKNVFNYGYNEQEQTELYLENQELKKLLNEFRDDIKIREQAILDWQYKYSELENHKPAAIESDAVKFAEFLTDNRIVSFFSKVTFGYHYARFKLFKNKR